MIIDTRPRGMLLGRMIWEKTARILKSKNQYPPRMDKDRFDNTFLGSGKNSDCMLCVRQAPFAAQMLPMERCQRQ